MHITGRFLTGQELSDDDDWDDFDFGPVQQYVAPPDSGGGLGPAFVDDLVNVAGGLPEARPFPIPAWTGYAGAGLFLVGMLLVKVQDDDTLGGFLMAIGGATALLQSGRLLKGE